MSAQIVPLRSDNSPTVGEVISRYLAHAEAVGLFCAESLEQRRAIFAAFVVGHGRLPVADCRAYMLSDWVESHTTWQSSSTRKAVANQINAAFNWAFRQGRIDRNPFIGVTYREAEPRQQMPDDDLQKIVAASNRRFAEALRFLRATGCRLQDVSNARWEGVDWQKEIVVIEHHKSRRRTGKPKVVFLVEDATTLLRNLHAEQGHPAQGIVFVNNKGTAWNRRTLGQTLLRLKKKGKVSTTATLHGIRHRAGSEAVASGESIKLVSKMLGHASVAITERYYCHIDGEIEAIRRAAKAAQPKKP